ncbi:MAG: hypothetical protein AMXMBFR82_28550 [Candidatus Hydrogenedentota bacterium]
MRKPFAKVRLWYPQGAVALLFAGLLCGGLSCTTLEYKGDVFAPSDKVDVLFALEDIEGPYTVIGNLTARAQANKVGVEKIQRKMIRAAMDRGADALVYVTSETSEVPNRNRYEEFRDPEERPRFGPEPTDKVRIIKALLVRYGEDLLGSG